MPKTLLLVLLCFSLAATAQNRIQIKITFSGNPLVASVAPKKLKYGKEGVLSIDFDDRPKVALAAATLMRSFTDGAGNAVKYTAGVASNSVDIGGNDYSATGAMSIADLKTLVNQNWGISCHGYYHYIPAPLVSQGFTVLDNVLFNRRYHFDQLKAAGVEYVIRTGVVPGNENGYHQVWKQLGFLAGTSQNTFDNLAANPMSDWFNGGIGEVNLVSNSYNVFARRFAELNTAAGAAEWINSINALIAQSSPTTPKILRYGLHTGEDSYLGQVFAHIESASNDRIWVTSLHELMEYFETKNKTAITQNRSGNVLTIELDQSALPDATRWRDLSLQLTADRSVASIEVMGADRYSFNPATGLLNVFKLKTSFAHPDSWAVMPVKFTSFTATTRNEGNLLQWKMADNSLVKHFEVEVSANGRDFKKLTTTTTGTFLDRNNGSVRYYRIKAVAKDGKTTYSEVIKTSRSTKKARISYTPGAGGVLSVEAEAPGPALLLVFNSAGSLLYKANNYAQQGLNQFALPAFSQKGILLASILNETLAFANY